MLYLLGVAHRAQARTPNIPESEHHKLFSQRLRVAIAEVRPSLIAEEDCEEFLSERGEVSIARQIADELGIEHRFCDANTEKRAELGYVDQGTCRRESMMKWDFQYVLPRDVIPRADARFICSMFPIRERFWIEALRDCSERVVIFICGDAHIRSSSFRKLLDSKNMPYAVRERGIGLTEADAWVDEALDYIMKHPEPASG